MNQKEIQAVLDALADTKLGKRTELQIESDERRAGSVSSEETKAKISAAGKGRVHSAETRAKLSATQKGYITSEETKAKLSAAGKGRVTSEETKAKLSAANKGRVTSEETKKKQSKTRKGRLARNKGYISPAKQKQIDFFKEQIKIDPTQKGTYMSIQFKAKFTHLTERSANMTVYAIAKKLGHKWRNKS